MTLLFITLFGLIFGSFIAAYTYRFQKRLSNFSGRSFCDNCKKQIFWHDNIPLLSYLLLFGKCRFCKKKISPRYPLIEFFTALVFTITYLTNIKCFAIALVNPPSSICMWNSSGSPLFYFYFYFIAILLLAIFIIDLENYIIPDELIYLLTFICLIGNVVFPGLSVYGNIFAGFMAATLLLFLHLITNKKGMGLGDVKLAIPIGFLLGVQNTLIWLLLSFVLGAFIGIFLIIGKRKKLKSAIPFGPFLIISFFLMFFFGDMIIKVLVPIY